MTINFTHDHGNSTVQSDAGLAAGDETARRHRRPQLFLLPDAAATFHPTVTHLQRVAHSCPRAD